MMLGGVTNEALKRISAARSLLRFIQAHEARIGSGDDASRSAKGMLFVQNYAVYEYVVVQSVRALVTDLNSRALPFADTRSELLAMALDPEFKSVASVSSRKTWTQRSVLLVKARSRDPVTIEENLLPKDGTHFRAAQLDTIWTLFGIPGQIVPNPRLRGHIDEMVETRNRIAHGSDAPDLVGGRFTVSDLEKRIDATEEICTHIVASVTGCARNATAFSA